MRPRQLSIGLLAALVACNDPSRPGEPLSFWLSAVEQWSGGELLVTSGAFRHGTPDVLVASEAVALERRDDTTFAFILPTGPSGDLRVRVLVDGHLAGAETIRRVGLRRSAALGVATDYTAFIDDVGQGPVLLARSYGSWQVVALDLRSGQVLGTPGLEGIIENISASHIQGAYLLSDTVTRRTGLWRLSQFGSTLVWPLWRGYWAADNSDVWALVMSGDSIVIGCTGPYDNTVFVLVPGGVTYFNHVCRDLVYRAGAAIVLAIPGGLALDAATGDSLYVFDRSIQAGGYIGGNILAVTTYPGAPYWGGRPDSLLEVEPGSGDVLRSVATTLSMAWTKAVVADPDERRFYVGGLGADSTVQLQVYDLANFRLIGTLTTGEKCPTESWICQGGALGVDPNFNRLHLVSPGLNAHEWTFDRLP